MSPRTAKQPDCDVLRQAGHAAQFWHVPQLLQRVGPRWAARPSLVGAPPAEVASRTFDSEMCRVRQPDHRDLPWHGNGVLSGLGHGRPAGLDGWALDRRAGPKPPRECLVCHRATAQVYSAWTAAATRRGAWLGVPTGTTGPRHDRRGSTDERDSGPKGRPQVRNEHLNEEGLVENARRPGTGGPSCIDN